MVKTKVFKKIAALTAALAIVGSFAVSASAVTVNTTTTYVEGNESQVSVSVEVTGVGGQDIEVTYYATNGETDVYVNQDTTDAEGKAEFNYETAAANLKSTVKVGYTGSATAEDAVVEGYKIYVGSEYVTVPTENLNGKAYTIPYTLPANKKLVGATATSGTVVAAMVDGGISVTLTGAAEGDVTVTPTLEDVIVENVICVNTAGAVAIADGANWKDVEEGQGVITVLADIDGLAEGREFGVIISDEEITARTTDAFAASEKAYRAQKKGEDGVFAVQVIDTAAEDAKFIKAGSTYYTAVYYVNAEGKYVIAEVDELLCK